MYSWVFFCCTLFLTFLESIQHQQRQSIYNKAFKNTHLDCSDSNERKPLYIRPRSGISNKKKKHSNSLASPPFSRLFLLMCFPSHFDSSVVNEEEEKDPSFNLCLSPLPLCSRQPSHPKRRGRGSRRVLFLVTARSHETKLFGFFIFGKFYDKLKYVKHVQGILQTLNNNTHVKYPAATEMRKTDRPHSVRWKKRKHLRSYSVRLGTTFLKPFSASFASFIVPKPLLLL